MTAHLGRGPFLSLRRRIDSELAGLRRRNAELRAARYPWPIRLLKALAGDRGLGSFLMVYLALATILVGGHAFIAAVRPALLPTSMDEELAGTLKDIGSYLLGGQLTVLGVVAVAVSVVTLLAQRTEGASARTEIRLYYVESFAYELATSGVALAIVLALQLFWPLQAAAGAIVGPAGLEASETALSVLHTLWLAVNLAIFFQFLITTLRFVEPNARMRLRERYSANAVIPRDVHRRLMVHLYVQLGETILGAKSLATGPHLSIGYGPTTFADAIPKVSRRFRRPVQLVDIWERPLGFAVARWAARVRNRVQPQDQPLIGRVYGERIVIDAHTGQSFVGKRDIVLVDGAVPLTWLERRLINLSLRFARVRPPRHELPAPHEILEELGDQVIGQIDRSAATGFKAALAELVQFHKFLLAAQHGSDETGASYNLARIGGIFEQPTQSWIGQYRRIYNTAASRLGEDPQFIDQLRLVPYQLMPDDAAESVPDVVADLLDLGVYQAQALEAWVTRHTIIQVPDGGEAAPRLVLAGSDQRAYESVLIKFVGSWETLLARLERRYRLQARRDDPAESWVVHGRAWRFVETHLRASAIMLATAVWNEDDYGAGRYRDLLLRWPERLEVSDRWDGRLRRRALLTPDWVGRPLDEFSDFAAKLSYARDGADLPVGALFSALWRGVFDDVVILSAAVTLSWHVRGLQSGDLGGQTSRMLLQREALDDGGRPLRGGGAHVFANVVALVIRSRFALRPSPERYTHALDHLVQILNGMSSRHIVPGRVYTSWGSRGVDSLDAELLAILAAFAPATGDGGVGTLAQALAQDDSLLVDGDRSLQDGISSLERFAGGLGEVLELADFERAVAMLSPGCDVATARARVAEILNGVIAALHGARRARLRAEPLDPDKIARFAAGIQARLEGEGLPLTPLRPGVIETGAVAGRALRRVHPGLDKGLFTTPSRSNFELGDTIIQSAEDLRHQLAMAVQRSLARRPKRVVRLSAGSYPARFWRSVAHWAASIEEAPVLIIPHGPTGELINGWTGGYGRPAPPGLVIERRDAADVGEVTHYAATINGVDVYAAELPADRALLFSATALRRLVLRASGDAGRWTGLTCREDDGGQTVALDFNYALSCEWDDSPVIEFHIRGLTEDFGDEA